MKLSLLLPILLSLSSSLLLSSFILLFSVKLSEEGFSSFIRIEFNDGSIANSSSVKLNNRGKGLPFGKRVSERRNSSKNL